MPQFFKCLKIIACSLLIAISAFLLCLHISKNAHSYPFLRAVKNNDINNVEKYLEDDENLAKAQYINSYTALHLATRNNNKEMVLILLRNGADSNIISDSDDSCLIMASEYGYLEVAEILIDNGADINQRGGRHEDTPLHIAVCKGNKEFVELLIKHGADISLSNSLGYKAIDFAKKYGNKKIIELLEKHIRHNSETE